MTYSPLSGSLLTDSGTPLITFSGLGRLMAFLRPRPPRRVRLCLIGASEGNGGNSISDCAEESLPRPVAIRPIFCGGRLVLVLVSALGLSSAMVFRLIRASTEARSLEYLSWDLSVISSLRSASATGRLSVLAENGGAFSSGRREKSRERRRPD